MTRSIEEKLRTARAGPRASGVLALTLALASAVSCGPGSPRGSLSAMPDRITLYEGLPHQGYEPARFAEERKKPTVDKGGFPFYEAPLPLNEGDPKALGAILVDPAAFLPFEGEKRCGGFHPDYAVVASSNGEETAYLICFGCGEAKVIRPDRSEARHDLSRDALPKLAAILKPYRKNRPIPADGP